MPYSYIKKKQTNEEQIKNNTETDYNPYEIKIKKTNKDGLEQPESVELDIFPKLPMGCLIIGRSGSGKTQAMINMLTNDNLLADYFDIVYLFTDAKPDKELIKDLKLEKQNIITDFDEEKVKTIMDRAENTIQKNGFKNSPKIMMLFDDILSNQKFLKSKTLTRLATANRHFNISYIFCSQYYKKLPPVVRTNARYYMIFPSSMSEVEKIADELCPPRISKKQFIQYLQYATDKQYSFLSINADSQEPLRRMFENILI
jgi:hypothetical protein